MIMKIKKIKFKPITKEAMRKMTPAKRRIVIAKEVIAYIKSGRLAPTAGVYLQLPDSTPAAQGNDELGCALAEATEPCEACAMGALFYSAAMKFNAVKIKSLKVLSIHGGKGLDDDNFIRHLGKYFTRDQYRLMEWCFEARLYPVRSSSGYRYEKDAEAVYRWQKRYVRSSDSKRLTVIMSNLIRNKGTFDPTDLRGVTR